ncbi:hypothetical protein EDD11_008694 [Mortierella claussenii]|nr:hypothetical protein EDD11_008694 [Mortierella claussenii]
MEQQSTSPWGLYALMALCIILTLSGFVWCFCCGTCVGRDVMRAAGLSRYVPPPYMQPSFMSRARYQRNKRSGDGEEGDYSEGEDIDMDVLVDEHHDSSVEYDYDFSEDDDKSDDDETGQNNTPYSRRPR